MLAEVGPKPLRLEADDGTTDRTTQEIRSGPTSQHTFLNFVRSERYDELSFGTPLRLARTGRGPEAGVASQRTRAHFGFRDRCAKRIGVSRLRGLALWHTACPSKGPRHRQAPRLPIRAAKFSKLTTSHDGFADWLEPDAV